MAKNAELFDRAPSQMGLGDIVKELANIFALRITRGLNVKGISQPQKSYGPKALDQREEELYRELNSRELAYKSNSEYNKFL